PNKDVAVLMAGGQTRAIGGKCQGVGMRVETRPAQQFLARGDVPNLKDVVGARCGQGAAVRRERDADKVETIARGRQVNGKRLFAAGQFVQANGIGTQPILPSGGDAIGQQSKRSPIRREFMVMAVLIRQAECEDFLSRGSLVNLGNRLAAPLLDRTRLVVLL